MFNRLIWLCSISVAFNLAAAPVSAEKQKKLKLLSSQPKISMKRAEKTALAKVPGQTKEIELERKKDGTLIYSVEIEPEAGKEVEVKIDALTGKVLEIEKEDDDKKESTPPKTE